MPILYKCDITPINTYKENLRTIGFFVKQIIAIEGVNLTLNIFTYSTHVYDENLIQVLLEDETF